MMESDGITNHIVAETVENTSKKSKSNRKNKIKNNPQDLNATANKETKIKPIIKNGKSEDENIENSEYVANTYPSRKKRNKSVSFLIDDGEQVEIKKSKSNSTKSKSKSDKAKEESADHINIKRNPKKDKNLLTENETTESLTKKKNKIRSRVFRNKERYENATSKINEDNSEPVPIQEVTMIEEDDSENRPKKNKKRKKQNSVSENIDSDGKDEVVDKSKPKNIKAYLKAEGDIVPLKKVRKTDPKPESIAEDLEDLKIGDNPHSLTSLLDDMTVSDKNKKKKQRKEFNRIKKGDTAVSNSQSDAEEKMEQLEAKEKIKWKKRKWNKGRVTLDDNWLTTTVIIENLPLTSMLNYKALLTEKFTCFGAIKNIGIAELYPTVVSKPVFITTIQFENEEAAAKALEEDNTLLCNSRIRVQRPLSQLETTIVVRSYGELNEQTLSSLFNSAGKIRSIRILGKGRRNIGAAFIEFDGPESQERAIEMAKDMKIGSKRLHASKFENRVKTNINNGTDNGNE